MVLDSFDTHGEEHHTKLKQTFETSRQHDGLFPMTENPSINSRKKVITEEYLLITLLTF